MGLSRWVAETDVLDRRVGKNPPLCSVIISFQKRQAALTNCQYCTNLNNQVLISYEKGAKSGIMKMAQKLP